MIKDLALDEMWETAGKESDYNLVAQMIAHKLPRDLMRPLSKHPFKEYLTNGLKRMLVIQKGDTRLMLMDQTPIVVPVTLRKIMLDKEHESHVGKTRMGNNIKAKYFWSRM